MSYEAVSTEQLAIVHKIAAREKISGILWLGLGIALFSMMTMQSIDAPVDQGPSAIPFIVSILDFAEGITHLRRVKRLRLRDATVINMRPFRFITVIALIAGNLVFGYIGILLVVFNFANARYIKENAALFNVKFLNRSTKKQCPACGSEVDVKATTCPNCQAVGI